MGNRTPKASVIVPCFNQAQYLPDALKSVLDQTFQDWECIIVNDGSTDNTKEIALDWINKDKRFRYLEKVNGGVSDARNKGISICAGEYILPLDADDLIGAEYMDKASEVLDTRSDIGIVYCNAEYIGDRSGRINYPDFSEELMLKRNLIFCSAVYRKSDYLKTKGYNTNMIYGLEDWDFWLSLIERGAGVNKLPGVHFYYRTKDNDSRNQDYRKDPRKRDYLFRTLYLNHIDLFNKDKGKFIRLLLKFKSALLAGRYKKL